MLSVLHAALGFGGLRMKEKASQNIAPPHARTVWIVFRTDGNDIRNSPATDMSTVNERTGEQIQKYAIQHTQQTNTPRVEGGICQQSEWIENENRHNQYVLTSSKETI